jgi:hypothetical protein
MDKCLILERLVRRDEADRDFDIEFWQALGDTPPGSTAKKRCSRTLRRRSSPSLP